MEIENAIQTLQYLHHMSYTDILYSDNGTQFL